VRRAMFTTVRQVGAVLRSLEVRDVLSSNFAFSIFSFCRLISLSVFEDTHGMSDGT
jgi:hypothetical protein